MTQNIVDKFNKKYPFEDMTWFMSDSEDPCRHCGTDIYVGEIALDAIDKWCAKCGIKCYEQTQGKAVGAAPEPKVMSEPVVAQAAYVSDNPQWMILSSSECYFCGLITKQCKHFIT